MRFGFSDGSCGSVRGSWWFQSPSPKSVENSTFWSLWGMAADPRGGVHNSGAWGLKLAKRVLPCCWGMRRSTQKGTPPTRAAGEARHAGEYTIRRVWGLEPAKKVLPRVLLGSTQFGSLGPELFRNGYSHASCSGEGPGATWKSSLGPRNCRKRKPYSTMNPGKRDSI